MKLQPPVANFEFAESVPPAVRRMYAQRQLLIDQETVERAVDRVAIRMTVALQDLNPLLVSVLPHGLVFIGMLMRRLVFPLQSTHAVNGKIAGDGAFTVQHRHVVVVDALAGDEQHLAVSDELRSAGASCVQFAVLLAGDAINDEFDRSEDTSFVALRYDSSKYNGSALIGCGLDHVGYGANLPAIYTLTSK
jgi:hypoxanthine-guanine phosphoribosyltransferase